MTKPADSDQIAKARRISEIAEREKKASKGPWFWRKCYEIGGRHWALKSPESEANGRVVGIMGTLALDDFTPPEKWHANSDNQFIAHARADIPFLLSELASERQAVIEECCRAVCELCARGVELEQLKLTDSDTLYWHHKSKKWQENGDCAATAIRSMGE